MSMTDGNLRLLLYVDVIGLVANSAVLQPLGSSSSIPQEIIISSYFYLIYIHCGNIKQRYIRQMCISSFLTASTTSTKDRGDLSILNFNFLQWNCFQPTSSGTCTWSTTQDFFSCIEGTTEPSLEQGFQVLQLELEA